MRTRIPEHLATPLRRGFVQEAAALDPLDSQRRILGIWKGPTGLKTHRDDRK